MKLNLNVFSVEKNPSSKYIYVYVLRCRKLDGSVITSEVFLSESSAVRSLKITEECFVGSLYSEVWLFKQICWL